MDAFSHFRLQQANVKITVGEGGGVKIVVTGPVLAEHIVVEIQQVGKLETKGWSRLGKGETGTTG